MKEKGGTIGTEVKQGRGGEVHPPGFSYSLCSLLAVSHSSDFKSDAGVSSLREAGE